MDPDAVRARFESNRAWLQGSLVYGTLEMVLVLAECLVCVFVANLVARGFRPPPGLVAALVTLGWYAIRFDLPASAAVWWRRPSRPAVVCALGLVGVAAACWVAGVQLSLVPSGARLAQYVRASFPSPSFSLMPH